MIANDRPRRDLWRLLGELPERDRSIGERVVDERIVLGKYRLQTLSLDLNGIENVPALWATPLAVEPPWPVVLYNHAHGGVWALGKEELIQGRKELFQPPYADELTARGWAVICIDHWNFSARSGRTESALFKEMIWRGRVLWGMMVFDSVRALDYLCSRPDVDSRRIATIGLSMGSTMAWWLAALDERIRVCVDLCCLTDFDALIAAGGLDGHGIYYYVPGLLNHFSAGDINALIAPRPHLSLAGTDDPLTPPAGLDRIDKQLQRVYGDLGQPDAWRLSRFPHDHYECAAMRQETLAFLERWL